ncbi:hypothetical protein KSP40_PGU013485 [Platanthera guangdongensis]|uniref:Uncharacterized protein n=1 Tax=Platanthera guangdongensis TaxID=2320717 RepID=A0ABR2LQQ2_9ASPA
MGEFELATPARARQKIDKLEPWTPLRADGSHRAASSPHYVLPRKILRSWSHIDKAKDSSRASCDKALGIAEHSRYSLTGTNSFVDEDQITLFDLVTTKRVDTSDLHEVASAIGPMTKLVCEISVIQLLKSSKEEANFMLLRGSPIASIKPLTNVLLAAWIWLSPAALVPGIRPGGGPMPLFLFPLYN